MGQESTGMRQESAGMSGFRQEWIQIPQESTGMGYFEFKNILLWFYLIIII
jgi:hypothetical protein